jgi:GT2 family glycosyltransferase
MVELTVVICTRNRPAKVHRLLDALDCQTDRDFELVVVDQSDIDDLTLDDRPGVRIVRDRGVGVARARNAGWHAVRTPWMLGIDDDCLPDRDWVAANRDAISLHPEVAVVWGHMEASTAPPGAHPDAMLASAFGVMRERLVAGRWIRPARMGLGVAAFNCAWLQRIGGWDERFGAGNADFPGSEDTDIAWRLYQAGGRALLSPRPQVVHESWRDDDQSVAKIERYATSWAGMCVKHARLGDPLGGAWLYAFCVKDAARMSLSPLRRRSRLRLRCAIAKWRGLWRGTRLGLQRSWR